MRDFWSMVWKNDVCVVVMVNDQEKDMVYCYSITVIIYCTYYIFVTLTFLGKLPQLLDGPKELADHLWPHAGENGRYEIHGFIQHHYICFEKQSGNVSVYKKI